MEQALAIDSLRVLSQIFTPATFNKIVRENDVSILKKKVVRHYPNSAAESNLLLLQELYSILEKNYRCEYFFKNKLFNQILDTYSLSKTTTLNEFRVGSSKADIVLLNGSVKIFEIKTELDSLSKLPKQIEDYQKFADYVSVVADAKFVDRLLAEYRDTPVGIIEYTTQNRLKERKKAFEHKTSHDFESIFKLLHKGEYLQLVGKNFGFIPDVPNTRIFRICFELLQSIDLSDFQKQVLNILKNRNLSNAEVIKSDRIPEELRYICYTLNLGEPEYDDFCRFLNQKV